ncbi:AAA family ATPase [Streptomyces cyaneofuscatus]|uniref:AAA family ATPase n=1 Tax=Streptomyces cyaneofuscatus TaxID=66883 RepID=UPI00344B2E38
MSAAATAPRTATAPPEEWEPGSMIVLVGPPASGKSTWTQARFPASARVSLDAFRQLLTDDEADQGANEEALDLRARVLDGRLRRGRTTVCDSTSIEIAARAGLLARARAYGRRAVAVRFDTPLEECLARNAARERTVREGVVRAMQTALPTVEELYAEGFDAVHHPGDTAP